MAYENWWVGIAFGHTPNDTAPVFTDISAFVESISDPIDTNSGDTAETSGDGGSCVLVLDNSDQRFTPGNSGSPYFPNVKSAVPIWIRETIGVFTFDLFRGFVEWPEIQAWTESSTAAPRSQFITMTAVDRLGRLRTSRRFISTLAAHIRGEGVTRGLVGHWPMGESGPPLDSVPSGMPLTPELIQYVYGAHPTEPAIAAISYGSADGPPGNDIRAVELEPARDVSGVTPVVTEAYSLVNYSDTYTLAAGEVLTIAAWFLVAEAADDAAIIRLDTTTLASDFRAEIYLAPTTHVVAGRASCVDWSGTVAGPGVGTYRWVPVALQFGFSPSVIRLWIGYEEYVGTMTVGVATPVTAERIEIGAAFNGSISDAQVYLGADGDYTQADFLAQYDVGLYGLDQQLTGDRIRTVLRYAGVPEWELGQIDDGVSVMQPANLAGLQPADAISAAVETEQGAIYVAGGGHIDFAGRRRRYNI